MKLTHSATIIAGKPILKDPARFINDCRRFEGKEIILTISLKRNKVSNQQYRYYFGVIINLWCEFTGYAPDQMDIILKSEFAKFNGWIDNNGFVVVPSKSNDFNTEIQEKFNKYCRDKYYDLTGSLIPLPNEAEV